MKKCKYHCDYGDGENCHYTGKSGCVNFESETQKNKQQNKQQKWFSVKEKLPQSVGNKVIVYLQHEDLVPKVGYGHYEKFQGEEMWYDLESGKQFRIYGYTVTHWMPMPKSPNGEELVLY